MVLFLFSLFVPTEVPAEEYRVEVAYSDRLNPYLLNVETITFTDGEGNVLWTREVNAPVTAYPLQDGRALLAIHRTPMGRKVDLEFADQDGSPVTTHPVEYFQDAVTSSDLARVLVHCAKEAVLYSNTGEAVARYPRRFSQVALDPSGTRVALTWGDTLSLYQKAEELVKVGFSNPYVRQIVFSSQGTEVAVLTSSTLELLSEREALKTFFLESYHASPKVAGFNEAGDRVLVVLRDTTEFKLVIADCADLSSRIYTRTLGSEDETAIEVRPDEDGWLVHLTSGWYRFNP